MRRRRIPRLISLNKNRGESNALQKTFTSDPTFSPSAIRCSGSLSACGPRMAPVRQGYFWRRSSGCARPLYMGGRVNHSCACGPTRVSDLSASKVQKIGAASALKISKQLRWTLWAGLIGIGVATVLVVLFRFTQSPLITRILLSADRLGVWIASSATRQVFPGDRIMYRMFSAAMFFDVALILATGLQTGFLGACIGFVLTRRSPATTR
jgi:hypothetical protein